MLTMCTSCQVAVPPRAHPARRGPHGARDEEHGRRPRRHAVCPLSRSPTLALARCPCSQAQAQSLVFLRPGKTVLEFWKKVGEKRLIKVNVTRGELRPEGAEFVRSSTPQSRAAAAGLFLLATFSARALPPARPLHPPPCTVAAATTTTTPAPTTTRIDHPGAGRQERARHGLHRDVHSSVARCTYRRLQ